MGARLARRRARAFLAATAAAAIAIGCWPAIALAAGHPAGAARPHPTALKTVSYRGYRFAVPKSWPVIRTARHRTACVRFDLHALYLGRPGANQNCPSWLVGTTEALVVQPGAAKSGRRTTENPVAHQITASAPRIKVTATFDTDPTVIYRILASARLAAPVIAAANPARLAAVRTPTAGAGNGARSHRGRRSGPAVAAGSSRAGTTDAVSASRVVARPSIVFGAAAPSLPATVTNEVGLGFDVCAAPSGSFMRAWRRDSRYRAVGVYIGGADRACDQQNLTAAWVREQAAAGWRFMPMYVGPQASFGQLTDPARQGAAAAADAVTQAQRLTFGQQTPIYYDMEAYGAAASGQALQFLSAWTRELHALGYLSGVYSSSSSGVADLARAYHSTRRAHPDVIFDALWNGAKNVTDSSYRNGAWSGRRRVHQFSGNVLQTFGGDTMDVDQDYLDLALTAPGGTTESAAGTIEAGDAATVFYRGSGNHLWAESRAAGGTWSRRDLGGQLSSEPSVVRVGKSGLAVFYRNGTGELTVIRRSAGRWLAPQVLARMGVIGGAPRAVAQTNGVIDVFWSGNYDKHLWHGEFNPGRGWSGPQGLQGSLASWPDPVESGSGVVQVFWEGSDGRLWRVVRQVGAAWTGPQALGMAPMGGPPHAVQLPTGETDVFWRGKIPHSIWSAQIDPDQRVRGPRNLGGVVSGAPWPVVAAGVESVVFRDPRGQLWQVPRTGGKWGQARPVQLAAGLSSAPFAASGGTGDPLQLFWVGSKATLWSARFTASTGWQQPVDLGALVQGGGRSSRRRANSGQ
jgi:hypothetical protein